MSKWIVMLASGPNLVVSEPPVMLSNGALATNSRVYAPHEWKRIMKEDGSDFDGNDVRALQGLPRVAPPLQWVDGPPPAGEALAVPPGEPQGDLPPSFAPADSAA